MSNVKENTVVDENKEWIADSGDWIWILLIAMLFDSNWISYENPRISKLEKKVARLEGQMSMIGGRKYE